MPLVSIHTIDDLFPGLSAVPVNVRVFDAVWGDSGNTETVEMLCRLAKSGRTPVVEIGTFRGRTTYQLAANCDGPIYTIDIAQPLPDEREENVERQAYPSYTPGELLADAPAAIRGKITQLIGDSRLLDLSRLHGTIGLVYVDAGHSYDACRSDSDLAMRLIRPGGVIVWDDYGDYWPGVKRAIDKLAETRTMHVLRRLGLVVFAG
jgi:predicted O-methyltransferase YrrM